MGSQSRAVREKQIKAAEDKLNAFKTRLAKNGRKPEEIGRNADVRAMKAHLKQLKKALVRIVELETQIEEHKRIKAEKAATPKAPKVKGKRKAAAEAKGKKKDKPKKEKKQAEAQAPAEPEAKEAKEAKE